MGRSKNRIISALLALAMGIGLFTALPVTAGAQAVNETIDGDNTDSTYPSYTGWNTRLVVSDMELKTGGKFRIDYTDEATIVLILTSSNSSTNGMSWIAVKPTTKGTQEDGEGLYAEYSYEDALKAYNDEAAKKELSAFADLSDVGYVRAATWSNTQSVIESINWISPDPPKIYESIEEWTFEDASEVSGWAKGGYWTNAVPAPTISHGSGKLQLEIDYTACTSTWNQTSIQYAHSKVIDLSEAEQVSFDFYATEAPEHFMAVFSGSVTGTPSKEGGATSAWKSASNRLAFDKCAVDTGETIEIGGVTYNKYEVTIPLTDEAVDGFTDVTSKDIRAKTKNFLVGLVRTDKAYKGYEYYDNIRIQKEKIIESGVTAISYSVDGGDAVALSDEEFEAAAASGATITLPVTTDANAAITLTPTLKEGAEVTYNTGCTLTDGQGTAAIIDSAQTYTVKFAAENGGAATHDNIKTYTFDSDTENWQKSGWSSGGFDGSTEYESGLIKFNGDYTGISVNYYQGDIQLWIGSPALDFSEADSVSLDLFCKSGDQLPNTADIIFSDGTNNTRDYVSVSSIEKHNTATINGVEYTKYSVNIPLTEDTNNVRNATQALIIQFTRTDKSFNGDVYLDNIKIQKPKTYSITLNTNEGTIADGKSITGYIYGKGATLPTSEEITKSGYTFGGWYTDEECKTEAVIEISTTETGDKTYYAKWTENAPTEYLIKFVNEDGTVLQSGNVAVGTTPSYTGETPEKEGDAQYSYTFKGWDKEPAAVTAEATYTATYNQIVNKYTITWQNENETTIDTTEVEYGATPTHEDAEKAAYDGYTYSFAGWTPEIVTVTGAKTYKATFNRTAKTYTITYNENGGTITNKEDYTTYTYGTALTLPEPAKDNGSFVGWYENENCIGTAVTEVAATNVTAKTFYAKWKWNTPNITVSDDKLAGFATEGSYEINGSSVSPVSGEIAIADAWYGTSVSVVRKGNGTNTADSDAKSVTIAEKDQVPGITITPYGGADGAAYDKAEHNAVTVSGTQNGDTVTYKLGNNSESRDVPKVTNAGTYSVTVKVERDGFDPYTGTVTVKVNKSPAVITAETAQSVVYDGSAKNVTASTDSDGTLVYSQRDLINSDTYAITVSVPETDNYLAASKDITFTITPATIKDADITITPYSAKYDTNEHDAVTVSGTAVGDTVKYKLGSEEETATVPKISTVGTYEVTVTVERPNYSKYTKTVTAQITNADMSGITVTPNNGTYDGKARNAITVNTGNVSDTITYKLDGGQEATLVPQITNAGTYTVTVKVVRAGFDDYETSVPVTISKAQAVITTEAVQSADYDGTAKNVTASLNNEEGILTYSRRDMINADTYTVTVSADESANYLAAESKTVTFTINKAKITGVTSVGYSGIVDGQLHGVTVNGVQAGDTLSYKVDSSESFTDTEPSFAEAGTHTIVVKVSRANHEDLILPEVTVALIEATPDTYTVLLNADGGTINGGNITSYTAGTAVSLPTDVTKMGYTFDGWYEDDTRVEEISASETGNKSYTAHWAAIEYSVTYNNIEDITGTIDDSYRKYTIETALTLPTVVRTGYTFNGWFDGEMKVEIIALGSTGNKTFEARWTADASETYTITWNVDGVKTTEQYTVGETPSFKGTPARAATAQYSYTFSGWGEELVPVTADKTYTAQFTEVLNEYTVTWSINGETTNEKLGYGAMPSNSTIPTKAATAQYTYVFSGWTPTIGIVTSDVIYTAQFKETPRTYAVKLNTNDGIINSRDMKEYTYGTAVSLPTAVTRSGYVFDGWYADKDLTGNAVTDIPATETGDKEYFAKWTKEPEIPKTYSISGRVVNSDSEPVRGAVVSIKQLANKTAQTDNEGKFVFSDIVVGAYSVAAEHNDMSATAVAQITDADTELQIKLPPANVSSEVEVKGETPKVIVGGLDDLAVEEAKESEADKNVTVTMEVESKEKDLSDPEQKAIDEVADTKNIDFIKIDIVKTIDEVESNITETPNLITIIIPFATKNKMNITVYRYHDSEAAALSENTTGAGEGFKIENGYIVIYANRFSTYAVGYDEVTTDDKPVPEPETEQSPTPAARRSSGGGKTKATPTPAPKATESPVSEKTAEPTTPPSQTTEPSDDSWFTDVPKGAWFYEPIKYAFDNGLMAGTSDTEFEPELNIQRAMFVTVLYRLDGEPSVESGIAFGDIPSGAYFEKAVAWASENGIVSGYTDTEFAPYDNITREQLAAMLWRYAKYKSLDVSAGEDTNILSYADAVGISEYAIPAVQWVCGTGIVGGFEDDTLRPTANTTRAQAATILQQFDNAYKVVR